MPESHDTTAQTVDATPASSHMKAAGGRRRWWILVACSILVLGLAVSLAGALLWRASVRTHNLQEFRVNTTDVRETLEPLLRRNTDFVTSLRAVLTMEPHMSATRFDQWLTQLQGNQRLVGGLGTTVVEPVAATELAAFQARRDANREFRELVGGRPQPVARSGRARYCLLSAGGTATPYSQADARLLQGDWCDPSSPIGSYPTGGTSQPRLMQSMTDSGQSLAYPVTAQGVSTLFLEAAFYKRGASLASVAQRRAAVAGWVGSSFDITALVRKAIGDGRGLSVALYHSNPGRSEELVARVGATSSVGVLASDTTMHIDGTWRAVVHGSTAVSGLSANTQALGLFLGGAIVSLLLFALVLVLTRSRERALGMVEEKTGQLRHQSLHDALTGLPNRVLALDRAEQMIARARRQHLPVAALYIDIDGFKHVNDTFGHATGDDLLKIVAARLAGVVREGDTAARLSGDEFVVLVEGSALDAGPELVAERLLEVLRQPYDIGTNGRVARQLSITPSIGIAFGVRESAVELLRDADLALYEAKAAGRNCYTLFESGMQAAAQDKLTLEMELDEALENEQLFLLYQPTFDLQSESVIGVEALIRWRHPTRGVIPPIEFIPIAEKSGLIVPISFLPSKRANVWLGGVLGLLVYSPFLRWRHDHAIHHATSGIGPIVALLLGPRLVARGARPRLRRSVIATNVALAVAIGVLCWAIGWRDYLLVQGPTIMLAGAAGVWLFYVQHQFEGAYWQSTDSWSYADAALRGSSYLKLPKALQFFSGNIGLHHVHHLSARIPNYNLQRAHDENPMFHDVPVLSLRDGLRSVRLKLWDEQRGRLVTFAEATDVAKPLGAGSPA